MVIWVQETIQIHRDGCVNDRGCHKNSRSGSEATNYAVNQLLLDAVVGQRAAILELLACKDQALLIWSSAMLITLP